MQLLFRVALVGLLSTCSAVLAQCSCKEGVTSPEHHAEIAQNYLDVWNGNLDLAGSTFSPGVVVHADRFPSSTGNGSIDLPVNSREAFVAFVERSRTGWDEYSFTPYKSAGQDLNIAIRWIMNGVVGANFTLAPTTLKQGDTVTYNGTEFLVLNPCTGLADEVHIAQDLIRFFHNLGLTGIPV